MNILGIETTCDETAASVVRNGKEILSNVIHSQVDIHKKYGGVYPELASRSHIDKVIPIIQQAVEEAGVPIDAIAVAQGPGLIGSLVVGINTAKGLSLAWDKPLIGVNHIEAHLYAAMMEQDAPLFPSLGVVISGGHTQMLLMKALGDYELIGTTVDDAIGEAFDKVAALLDLPYPGGPAVEALARSGDPTRFPLKAGRVKGHPFDFSFSGLKTNVLYTIKGPNSTKESPSLLSETEKADLAASFQHTALQDIARKSLKAAREFSCKAIYLGGGVTQNSYLRSLFPDFPIFYPPKGLSLDNAAMIAGLAYHLTPSPVSPSPRLSITL